MSTIPSPQGPMPPLRDPDRADPTAPPDDPDISPYPDPEPDPDEDPDEQLPRREYASKPKSSAPSSSKK